jgi:RNA polymerase sigma factor (sigma-70 family)
MIKNSFISDQEILVKVGNNDIEGLGILYDRYAPLLIPMIKEIVDDDETAESVLMDSFLIGWKWAEEFDFTVKNVFTWLFLLTRNKAIDTLKRKRGDTDLPEYNDKHEILNILPQLSPKNESLEREYILKQSNEISKIIKSLNEEQKNLFQLFFYKGYDEKGIAEKMGIPGATVKPQIQYIMGILMERLIN